MPNREIELLIATHLRLGFTHPGDPARDIPPTPILLPFKSRPHQPEEMHKLLNRTAELLSECIVSLIETEGESEIVPRDEARTMRRAAGSDTPNRVASVHCRRCDRKRTNPLAVLSVGPDPDTFLIDGKVLLRELHKRDVACPHTAGETTSDADILRDELTALLDGLPARMVSKKARTLIDEKMAAL